MKKLDNEQLKNVKGGIGFWGIAGIISGGEQNYINIYSHLYIYTYKLTNE